MALYYKNLDRERARQREWDRKKEMASPGRRREMNWRGKLQREYGITPRDWDEMIVAQSGLCAVCDVQLSGVHSASSPCVDHDHDTGRVRAILCRNCNSAIGMLQDSPDRAMALATYLLSFTNVLEMTHDR
jgi:hypothetical protein